MGLVVARRSIKHVIGDPGPTVRPGPETGAKGGESQTGFEEVC